MTLATDSLGDAVMAQLAEGSLTGSDRQFDHDLQHAVQVATTELAGRRFAREDELIAENEAFASTRRASLQQVHERRMAVLEQRLRTLVMAGHARMVPAAQGQLKRERERFETRSQELVDRHAAMLAISDLAVCLVEVEA